MPRLTTALRAARPAFLTASLLPVLLGTAWGWRAAGRLDAVALALALLATALAHLASNVYNDVGDELTGTDRANTGAIRPFTGGSGAIQSGAVPLRAMQRLAGLLGLAAAGCGALLALRAGPAVLAFGLAGLGLGVAYSMPGLRLAGRGLGELAIALAFGPLPVAGAAWLQRADAGASALLLSLPVAAWVAAIIIANEIPDAAGDAATGKRTLAVRLGRRTPLLYAAVQAAGGAAAVLLAVAGRLPAWSWVLPVALLAAALAAARDLAGDRARLARGIRATLAIHAAGCSWLLACVLLA